MPATEHPLQALAAFLPEKSFEQVAQLLHQYKVHLTITKKRKSVLGDYRHAGGDSNHRISINGNLNKYEFLITLLHELAHLLTFEKFRNRVEAHGKEWKQEYSRLLIQFVSHKIFPPDIEGALQSSIRNPAATASGESELLLALRAYNAAPRVGVVTVDELQEGELFETENGRIFKKMNRRRKRIACIEMVSGLTYSFSAITEVKRWTQHYPRQQ
jgi:SprT protein